MEEYGLSMYAAEVLTSSRDLADYFEECHGANQDPKLVSNWVMGEVQRWLKAHGLEAADHRQPQGFGRPFAADSSKCHSNIVAKDVGEMLPPGSRPRQSLMIRV